MKELHEQGGFAIAVFDDKNYVVYDKRKPSKSKDKDGIEKISYKLSYYNNIPNAVKEVARLNANERCTNLDNWLTIYRDIVNSAKLEGHNNG